MSVIIRDMRAGDRAYVIDSWWRAWSDDVGRSYHLPRPVVQLVEAACRCVVLRVIDDPGVRVRVACAEDDPDTIAGWAAFAPREGMGIYGQVKMALRRCGVWTMLAADAGVHAYAIDSSSALRWGLLDGLERRPEWIRHGGGR